MSLIGGTTAFIPIGISCQSTRQLALNCEAISSLLGEPLEYRSSFFNWVMVSADDIVRVLERLTDRAITRPSIRVPSAYWRANTLAGYRVWFWHEKPSHETSREMVGDLANKYEHLRQNFLDLCARPNRFFVLCNTQNNISSQDPYLDEGMSLIFDDHLIAEIRSALARLFPTGTNHLLVVGRPDRLVSSMREQVHVPPDDATEWQGHDAAWSAIMASYLKAIPSLCPGRPGRLSSGAA